MLAPHRVSGFRHSGDRSWRVRASGRVRAGRRVASLGTVTVKTRAEPVQIWAARQSAPMILCYLPFGTTWLPSRHRHFAWTPSDQPLLTRHGPYPNPAGHRGQDVLPAETNAGQGPQGSDAMPQTAAVRRRLPTTAPRPDGWRARKDTRGRL